MLASVFVMFFALAAISAIGALAASMKAYSADVGELRRAMKALNGSAAPVVPSGVVTSADMTVLGAGNFSGSRAKDRPWPARHRARRESLSLRPSWQHYRAA